MRYSHKEPQMRIKRREFISLLSATAITALPLSEHVAVAKTNRIKAIAVDAFVVFDPRPIEQCAEELFPGRGTELTSLWRTRQFEYTWLRRIGNHYKDFWQVTEDALNNAASEMRLPLAKAECQRLMGKYETLPPWPDVPETLSELRRRNIRIAFLSNFSAAMLHSNLAAAKLEEYFEPHLTTDRVDAFKPSPVAYQMGPDGFALELHEIGFAAFGSWDAVGAKWFGYPTIWVNRSNRHWENLDIQSDATTSHFRGILDFLDERNCAA